MDVTCYYPVLAGAIVNKWKDVVLYPHSRSPVVVSPFPFDFVYCTRRERRKRGVDGPRLSLLPTSFLGPDLRFLVSTTPTVTRAEQ